MARKESDEKRGSHAGGAAQGRRRTRGIVSGRRAVRRAVAQAAAGGAFPNFINHGGPVIATPQVLPSFWGVLWSDQAHQQRAAQLAQFFADLLQSPFMNVLSQYGVGQGAGAGGAVGQSSFIANVPGALTDPNIRQIIQTNLDAGNLPEPASPFNQVLVLYLDENTGINDPGDGLVLCEPQGDTAFGYHDFFTTTAGNSFYYAVIPALDDNCLRQTCPQGSGACSLNINLTQLRRLTQVASHEFAEMTTDPQLNAWVDQVTGAGEVGDICNGESASIRVGSNSWNVQLIYSKTDDTNSNGAVTCVAQEPAPLPSLV